MSKNQQSLGWGSRKKLTEGCNELFLGGGGGQYVGDLRGKKGTTLKGPNLDTKFSNKRDYGGNVHTEKIRKTRGSEGKTS